MIRKLKAIRADPGHSIFVGERYEKNMRGIAIGAALIVIVNLITVSINLHQGNRMGAVGSLVPVTFFR